jgi:hypothetical protein
MEQDDLEAALAELEQQSEEAQERRRKLKEKWKRRGS